MKRCTLSSIAQASALPRVYAHRPGWLAVELGAERNRMVIRNLTSEVVERSITFTPGGWVVVSDRAHPWDPGATNRVLQGHAHRTLDAGQLPPLTADEAYARAIQDPTGLALGGGAEASVIGRVVAGPGQSWYILVIDFFSRGGMVTLWRLQGYQLTPVRFSDHPDPLPEASIDRIAPVELRVPMEWALFEDGCVREWASGEVIGQLTHLKRPFAVDLSSARFAIRTRRYRMCLRGLDGEHLFTTRSADADPTAACFSSDGASLYVGTRTGAVHRFDAHSGALLTQHQAHTSPITTLAVHANGEEVYSGDRDGGIVHTDFNHLSESTPHHSHGASVRGIAITTEGFSWTADGSIQRWPLG